MLLLHYTYLIQTGFTQPAYIQQYHIQRTITTYTPERPRPAALDTYFINLLGGYHFSYCTGQSVAQDTIEALSTTAFLGPRKSPNSLSFQSLPYQPDSKQSFYGLHIELRFLYGRDRAPAFDNTHLLTYSYFGGTTIQLFGTGSQPDTMNSDSIARKCPARQHYPDISTSL